MTHFGLTGKMLDCLRFIEEHLCEHGEAPSYDEIGAAIGSTRGNVQRLLTCLQERGWVDFLAGKARSLRMLRAPPDVPLDWIDRDGLEVTPAGGAALAEFRSRTGTG